MCLIVVLHLSAISYVFCSVRKINRHRLEKKVKRSRHNGPTRDLHKVFALPRGSQFRPLRVKLASKKCCRQSDEWRTHACIGRKSALMRWVVRSPCFATQTDSHKKRLDCASPEEVSTTIKFGREKIHDRIRSSE